MKHMYKEIYFIAIVLAIVLIFYNAPAYNAENLFRSSAIVMTAEEKRQFSDEMDHRYQRMVEEERILAIEDSDRINELLLQAAWAVQEPEEIRQELEKYGLFEFPAVMAEEQSISADPSDVTVNKSRIYYRADDSSWYVVTGGYWNNTEYDGRFLFLDEKVGDSDAFGVRYTHASGYQSAVLEVIGRLGDGEPKEETRTTDNRSDGDGGKGFYFRLQDRYISRGFASYSYLGDRWAGVCRYNSDFEEFSGVITGYYVHTYSAAEMPITD